jgi:hypothetical protein
MIIYGFVSGIIITIVIGNSSAMFTSKIMKIYKELILPSIMCSYGTIMGKGKVAPLLSTTPRRLMGECVWVCVKPHYLDLGTSW